MLLPLITPVGANFLKDFPSQHAVDAELIDAYAGPYEIQTYTPIVTCSVANPVLGTTGFAISGNYYRLFDEIITWGEFRFGTGFSSGNGTFEVTLPFDANSILPPGTGSGDGPILGSGQIWDDSASAGRQPVTVQLRTINKIMFSLHMDSGAPGRAVDGNNSPITWAINDGINWLARYQRLPV